MMRVLILLLPCLIPSWRFFKSVEPSPRVQWRGVSPPGGPEDDWQDYRPAPQTVSVTGMLRRLIWNPDRNRDLWVVSLSERLILDPSAHSHDEICRRVAAEATAHLAPGQFSDLQFRLLFISREDGRIESQISYVSNPFPLAA